MIQNHTTILLPWPGSGRLYPRCLPKIGILRATRAAFLPFVGSHRIWCNGIGSKQSRARFEVMLSKPSTRLNLSIVERIRCSCAADFRVPVHCYRRIYVSCTLSLKKKNPECYLSREGFFGRGVPDRYVFQVVLVEPQELSLLHCSVEFKGGENISKPSAPLFNTLRYSSSSEKKYASATCKGQHVVT